MKINKYYYMTAVVLVGAAFLAVWQLKASAQYGGRAITLSLKTEKEDYVLGEMIGLRFDVRNTSGADMAIARPSVNAGNLRLFVSRDSQNYVEYVGPNWGTLDAGHRKGKLGAGESFKTAATMLFNRRIPTEHLTPMYADRIKKERIDTEFAMLTSGPYWLRAVFTDGQESYRSEPIQINVAEPVGIDSAVWERIKNDGAYAYLLQTGEVKYLADSKEARKFVEELQQVSSEYANTTFAGRLNEQLGKYNRNIENVRRLVAERQAEN